MNVNNRSEIASYAKHAPLRDNMLQKWYGYQPSTYIWIWYSDPNLNNPIKTKFLDFSKFAFWLAEIIELLRNFTNIQILESQKSFEKQFFIRTS